MERVIKIFAKAIITLFCLSLFASVIQHVSQGGTRYGFLTEPIRVFSSVPGYFKEAVSAINDVPKTFLKTPDNFKPINELKEDVLALISYTNDLNGRSVKLLNFRNDKTLFEWILPNSFEEHHRVLNPILLNNKSLCYSITGYSGLKKIDSLGKLLWEQSGIIAHHSLNIGENGSLWMCAFKKGDDDAINFDAVFNSGEGAHPFLDNLIVQIDENNGEILFEKSLTEIFKENNLLNLLKKTHNLQDPYHTNDIEPVLENSATAQIGDLYVSIRHLSLIIHYRPSSNEVLNLIEGPFSGQHDVDILNDSIISIFNNNVIIGVFDDLQKKNSESPINVDLSNSSILSYNTISNVFTPLYDSLFNAYSIFTGTEGLHQVFDQNKTFIEEQNSGVLWIIKDNTVIYKNVLGSHIEGYHHLPNWIRIIE